MTQRYFFSFSQPTKVCMFQRNYTSTCSMHSEPQQSCSRLLMEWSVILVNLLFNHARKHGDSVFIILVSSRQQHTVQVSAPFSSSPRRRLLTQIPTPAVTPKMFSQRWWWYSTQVSSSSPPVTVSPLSAAIHHGQAIWVHLQLTGPRQEGSSVCHSLSNDTRLG